ncbi:MAG: sugar transporter subunit [Bacillota bacterium]|nr:sugar transporter subunit [Bacillota bacterium]
MKEILQKNHIRVKEPAATWEDAIRRAGSVLAEAGSIKPEYIDYMIESVREYGPYVVISPMLAIAHAAPGKGVIRNDMSLITLSSPVNFGSENDPVSVVLCFGSIDPTSHIDRLTRIAELLSKESRISDLACAGTVDEVITVLNR